MGSRILLQRKFPEAVKLRLHVGDDLTALVTGHGTDLHQSMEPVDIAHQVQEGHLSLCADADSVLDALVALVEDEGDGASADADPLVDVHERKARP